MKLILLGDPVGHSLSPVMQRAALDAAGIDGSYEARRVDGAGLAHAVAQIRSGELTGGNVTMPHKGAAAARADEVSPEAKRTAAANTLAGRDGRVVGANTDVAGVRVAWSEAGLEPDQAALVLGAGGAAAAALVALEGSPLAISARRDRAAATLLAELGIEAEVLRWGTGPGNRVVVNATPLGMDGEALPVPTNEGLIDMAYGRSPTPAVDQARRAGIPVTDGLDFLVAQGAASFEIWTGRPAPVAEMTEAVRRASDHRMS